MELCKVIAEHRDGAMQKTWVKRAVAALALGASALGVLGASGCAGIGAQPSGEPSLWVVRDADSTLYLFGTLHVLREGEAWGGPRAMAALKTAQEVWTEIEIDNANTAEIAQVVVALGIDPTRKLSDRLTADEKVQFEKAAKAAGFTAPYLDAMKPWLAALTLAVAPMRDAGYNPDSGSEKQIDAAAEGSGQRLRWFESATEQVRFMADLPDDVQMQLLRSALKDFTSGAEGIEEMARAWSQGDDAALSAQVIDQMKQEFPQLYDVLFTQRNQRWADTIVKELQGSGVDFVAVGAGHLLGPDSVQVFLAKRGVKAERVMTMP